MRSTPPSARVRQRLFSPFTTHVGTWLKRQGHEPWFFWYVTGCIFCSLCVYVFMRDTARHHRFGAPADRGPALA